MNYIEKQINTHLNIINKQKKKFYQKLKFFLNY